MEPCRLNLDSAKEGRRNHARGRFFPTSILLFCSLASCLDLSIRICEVLQGPDSYAMAAALLRKRAMSVEMLFLV